MTAISASLMKSWKNRENVMNTFHTPPPAFNVQSIKTNANCSNTAANHAAANKHGAAG
jgi:hypothetical protein